MKESAFTSIDRNLSWKGGIVFLTSFSTALPLLPAQSKYILLASKEQLKK